MFIFKWRFRCRWRCWCLISFLLTTVTTLRWATGELFSFRKKKKKWVVPRSHQIRIQLRRGVFETEQFKVLTRVLHERIQSFSQDVLLLSLVRKRDTIFFMRVSCHVTNFYQFSRPLTEHFSGVSKIQNLWTENIMVQYENPWLTFPIRY